MAKTLDLAYLGDPILRKKAEEISEVTDEIRELIDDMITTMDVSDGIGLAAPQIKRSIRLFVICPYYKTEDGEWEKGEVTVFINPKLTEPDLDDLVNMEEGCLSIPGIHGIVTRPDAVTVEALDRDGNPFKKRYQGMEARIIMHENDHLNGVLFPDRMDKRDRKEIEPKLALLKKKLEAASKKDRQ